MGNEHHGDDDDDDDDQGVRISIESGGSDHKSSHDQLNNEWLQQLAITN